MLKRVWRWYCSWASLSTPRDATIYVACFSALYIAFRGFLMLVGGVMFGEEWSWWDLIKSSIAAPLIGYIILRFERMRLRVNAQRNGPRATSDPAHNGDDTT